MLRSDEKRIHEALESLDGADTALKAIKVVHQRAWTNFRALIRQHVQPGQVVSIYGRLFDHHGDPKVMFLLEVPREEGVWIGPTLSKSEPTPTPAPSPAGPGTGSIPAIEGSTPIPPGTEGPSQNDTSFG